MPDTTRDQGRVRSHDGGAASGGSPASNDEDIYLGRKELLRSDIGDVARGAPAVAVRGRRQPGPH